ncbi:MAG: hypothetical protein KatS3mg119_0493 [Rhodothalassiaceae bacterium]|nr:MAG: hypothetical protein KatS3mg119_0493 [Rhodothalassiaceae bacterium]
MERHGPREVLLEFRRIGRHVKVTAIDPDSGVEVTVVGDAATPEDHLIALARRKLARRLARGGRGDDRGPGILV